MNLHRLEWDLDALGAFIIESLRPGGTWTARVLGAVAEFCVGEGEPWIIETEPDAIRALSPRGAISFSLGDHVRPFAFGSDAGRALIVLATPRGTARPLPTTGLVRIGPDREAVRAQDRDEILYEFGVNHVAAGFGVRTATPDLIARLDGTAGLDWRRFLPLIGDEIRRASPTRVVRNSIGRIEVFTTIPPPDEVSPAGPHSHFLPPSLTEPQDAPAGIDMPEAYVACAIYYPPRAVMKR